MQQFNGYIAQVLVKLRTCVWCTRLRRAKNFRPWVLLVCGGLVFHCKHFFSCLNTRSVWVFAKKTGALAATGIVFQIQSDPFRCNVHSKGTVLSSHGIEGLLVQPVFGSVSSGVDLSLLVFCRQLMFFIVFPSMVHIRMSKFQLFVFEDVFKLDGEFKMLGPQAVSILVSK